ncbi:unnamed protein product [Durusdinium trenchii]|uniref:Bestrophin homolog n=2 Tax=Durusdinium trenchii TaxID=1381693 RepID=A0ABP0LMK5_9DINO
MDSNKDDVDVEGLFPVVLDLWSSSLPRVFQRSELRFFCGIHLATWGAFQEGWFQQKREADRGIDFDLGSILSVDWVDLKMLTMISTVLLSFYVHQCFRRYQLICTLTMRMFSSVHDIAFQARLFLDTKKSRLCSRWVTLAALLSLATGPSTRAWRKLLAHGLVRRVEVEPLRRMGEARGWLLLQETVELLHQEVSGKVLSEMISRILAFRDCQQEILETKRLSLPFTYHHLLTVVIMVNLSLLSYGSALSTTCLAPPIFFLVAIFFFGMMEVSVQLWDPLSDESSLPVQRLTQEFLWSMHALIYYEHDGPDEKWQSDLREESSAPCAFLL